MNETEVVDLTEEQINEDMISTLSLICALVMNVMCIVGIVANSLSLFIYTRPNFNKRSINIFLAALSASDLVVSLLAVPVFSISQLQSLMPGTPMITATVMLYFYPVTLMAQTMSVWLLVAITIDRYLAVCHPFVVASYCTKKRALITVAIITIFSIAYNFVRFWEFTLNEEVNTSGVVEDLLVPLLRGDKMFMLLYQNLLTLLTQFLLPLIVLCYFNFEVIRTILKATEQRRELVSSERREHSTAKMMIYVVLVFIFCYTFSFMLNVAEIIDESLFRSSVGYLLNDVNNILIVLNSSSSIIFYCTYSTRYRAQLLRTCSFSFLKRLFVSKGRSDKGTVILSECSALVNTTAPSPNRHRSSINISPHSSHGSSTRCSAELTLPPLNNGRLLRSPDRL